MIEQSLTPRAKISALLF